MSDNVDFLRVEGTQIVNGLGKPVRLRGFCLGGWLSMENFITGYAGTEASFRASIQEVLGSEKAEFFFDRYLDYFIGEADIDFMKSLGVTAVRVAVNYRHFENDMQPFQYNEVGFKYLDRLIGWCRDRRIYVILDLHAPQGWQNPDWHSDNPGIQTLLWEQKQFEDRAIELWKLFARRYRNEAWIAGYDLINEPVAKNVAALNRYYRRAAAAVREIDPDHILFIEGNQFAMDFTGIEAPFESNAVYSSHNYVLPGITEVYYPGNAGGKRYDREQLEVDYLRGNAFMQKYQVPTWVGEFGSNYLDPALDDSKNRVTDDMLSIFEKHSHHWTIWTYKDIGTMGTVLVNRNTDWMRRTAKLREMDRRLQAGTWEVNPGKTDALLMPLVEYAREVCGQSFPEDGRFYWELKRLVRAVAISNLLTPLFAEQFRGMGMEEIDRMMQSFRFEQCTPRLGLVDILRIHLERPV